ncbi:geranylgeranylglyceryl/heptaprenylglyceryl phosphate synthase [candidate division KSB1 bacterium]|nr:geranylgeranylglyceryl/heptaprenylglyceryl phosphate synthase [candidate division KSB1 bacterium]NIR70647.1 geranylgeranylglyceryl/heptaprenylglyceryl phosphate synthase [candidate division KSB1 bacterium]NIS24577.1 geranylgeranylglyceryl/heptaprenylglyceryl phosphate synthase [candidate division KSB1 bacterium]NIT71490.1 geranylgeranylglyceryl/heptaprenylglyceryl phosphate synthase [candidate division KSB1 bacterium]NIU25186.1 geranylgeranylglyceryl/heptaprenylglyceryl phosphate synthase [c
MTTLQRLLNIREQRGAGYLVLIDPDKWQQNKLVELASQANEAGADALLIGGSLLLSSSFDNLVGLVKKQVDIPVIIFPGSPTQVSQYADAIFFLSLISGRNPTYLIEEQVKAAPVIKALGVEPISVGYMLIESGRITSAEFMSNTRPIPRDKLDIAKATALAAEYLGMDMVYLEAGSGAHNSVPDEMVGAIQDYIERPVIVGGGIKKPEEAQAKVESGAAFVVTGNILEKEHNFTLLKEFADAIHR